jgi:PAS domain S-box-containing protein
MSGLKSDRIASKILIVEDEALVAETLAESLISLGYDIAGKTDSAEEAIRISEESVPHLVLMDISLTTNIDGIEAAEDIRTRFGIPVVYLTGYGEKDVFERAKKTQPYGYLSKPVELQELSNAIEIALYRHEVDKKLRASEAELQRLVHELAVHQAQLEAQNDELLLTQTELRQSEERFRLLFEGHGSVMLLIEPNSGSIVDANPAAAEYYGYSRSALCKMSIEDINCLQPEEVFAERKLAQQEERSCFVFPHRLSTGEIRTVEVYSYPIDVSRRTLLFSIVHDITERKNAENALRESEEKYRLIIDRSPVGIIHFDSNGLVNECNQASQEIFGSSKEQIIGLNLITSVKNEEVRLCIESALSGKTGRYEGEYTSVTGLKTRWLNLEYAPVVGKDGLVLGGIGILQDFTERIKAEEEKSGLIIELQNALAQVKKLSGFLPICASCKKIRDDSGYWHQVERYVTEHSEAEFSHGICPDCIRKLYPEIADEFPGRQDKDEKK